MSRYELNTATQEEATEIYDPEPRWPALVAILAVGGLYAALPMRSRWARNGSCLRS